MTSSDNLGFFPQFSTVPKGLWNLFPSHEVPASLMVDGSKDDVGL